MCNEWRTLSTFLAWWESQYFHDDPKAELTAGLISDRPNHYSPNDAVLLPTSVKAFALNNRTPHPFLPVGVTYSPSTRTLRAQMSNGKGAITLLTTRSTREAFEAYWQAKMNKFHDEVLPQIAVMPQRDLIEEGLLRRLQEQRRDDEAKVALCERLEQVGFNPTDFAAKPSAETLHQQMTTNPNFWEDVLKTKTLLMHVRALTTKRRQSITELELKAEIQRLNQLLAETHLN